MRCHTQAQSEHQLSLSLSLGLPLPPPRQPVLLTLTTELGVEGGDLFSEGEENNTCALSEN